MKKIFCDKRAEKFTLAETMKIILGVLSIGLLLGLSVAVYGIFTKEPQIKQAKATLTEIKNIVENLEGGGSYKFLLESPMDWYLVYFEDGGYKSKLVEGVDYEIASYRPRWTIPPAKCSENCLCVCPMENKQTGEWAEGMVENIVCDKGICEKIEDKKIEKGKDIVEGIKIEINEITLSRKEDVISINRK